MSFCFIEAGGGGTLLIPAFGRQRQAGRQARQGQAKSEPAPSTERVSKQLKLHREPQFQKPKLRGGGRGRRGEGGEGEEEGKEEERKRLLYNWKIFDPIKIIYNHTTMKCFQFCTYFKTKL